jgi:hypothetical protein
MVRSRWARRLASLAASFLLPLTAAAQADTLFTLTYRYTDAPTNYDETTIGTCRGRPTCSGSYTSVIRFENCTNYLTFSGSFGVANLTVGATTVTGILTVNPGFYNFSRAANGVCSLTTPTPADTGPFTASYNPATGTGSGTFDGTDTFTIKVDTSAPPPPFEMVVRSQIGPQTATATADIQFRPQDVGTNGRPGELRARAALVLGTARGGERRAAGGLLDRRALGFWRIGVDHEQHADPERGRRHVLRGLRHHRPVDARQRCLP